jgi:ribosomal protein S18 acetylase RimI-like enzyme
MTVTVRPMTSEDAVSLSELLNHTIALGGSTAYEAPFSPDAFLDEFLTSVAVHSAQVAVSGDQLVGFQVLYHMTGDHASALAIATFADQRVMVRGIGKALFEVTRKNASNSGAPYIQAVIRGDNVAGLAYYRGRGFMDYGVRKAVPLADGTPVDRIETRFVF